MTTVVASPRRHHATRAVLKASAAALLLLATTDGVWHGSQAAAAHFLSQPVTEVSYASTDHTASMLQKANHSAASKAGSFIGTVSLSDANVQGVRVDDGS